MINQGKTQKLDELVELVLKVLGLEQKLKELEIAEIWPEVVGNMIASRTRKLYIAEGRLFVSFTSAVVRNEILMVKEGVIAALNEKIGSPLVKDIIIK